MNVMPGVRITLTEGDLQKIWDAALDRVKNTSNMAIDSRLHAISCTITAFVDFVNKEGAYLTVIQPSRTVPESIDSE